VPQDSWKSYSGAPVEGTGVCRLDEVPDGDTLCLDLDGYPIVVVRFGWEVLAYVNACPHQYLPLNHRGDRLMSADKTILRCTSHGAGFSARTGDGVAGYGLGACLDPVPVHLDGTTIRIGQAGGIGP
jgi:nitrite reductase/ring-hydroxylating ferredoxin subunit